ncbi:hypothetical protein [Chryseobacterium luquanense]|uniref:DUF2158 domain-containing protein n=1 Tax=Chryseobacterium luquanense TaxID=2983766 RepID=A0ABT3Y8W2_9FLAO|nr:hypothetical protein [Chryseobacterium luquanense]MCX8534607.1 hypothetical protein [Chryseobacterium luquanense]
MKKYNFEDFDIGDSVYHKSNKKIIMIVIATDSETKEIKCRWIDNNGQKTEEEFLFAELINADDFDRSNTIKYRSIL